MRRLGESDGVSSLLCLRISEHEGHYEIQRDTAQPKGVKLNQFRRSP